MGIGGMVDSLLSKMASSSSLEFSLCLSIPLSLFILYTHLLPRSQENERTKDLIVEQKFHRAIIGQKGEKIKEVRDKFPEVPNLIYSVGALGQD